MGRPREFDTDKALDRAMGVFWVKGYEGASLQDLLKAMKIARGSLYKAFKDKHSIYLAALDRYDHTIVQGAVDTLRDEAIGDGLARIRALFEAAQAAVARADRRGCFMCNAAIDQAPINPKIRAKVGSMMKRLEGAFASAVEASRKTASWSAKRRVETARLLLNSYMGVRVLARSGYPADDLVSVINASLRNCGLEGPRSA
ncbi:MAG TPA: TetR/AcrR family transcriptional regulator [Methyloceanibacter sp.]|nr:TetR/AcrR family transcriptional regulator [Methyloceanibacter sp.]